MSSLSLIIPCWKRPQSTRKLLLDVLNQTIDGWEALFVGDCCKDLNNLFDCPEIIEEIKKAENRGNSIKKFQLDRNYGGHGYAAINAGIQLAKNEFVIFAGNDDRIASNHFENYLYPVRDNNLDIVIFDSVIKGITKRVSAWAFCKVGHSEIIVRASIAKIVDPHTPDYGHDWIFIVNILKITNKAAKDLRGIVTYNVIRLAGDAEAA